MIGVTKIGDIEVGMTAKIVGTTTAYNSYVSRMAPYIGSTMSIREIIGIERSFRMGETGLYFSRADLDIDGDIPCISEDDIRPRMIVKVGKELNNLDIEHLTNFYFPSSFEFNSKYERYMGGSKELYGRNFYVINDNDFYKRKHILTSIGHDNNAYETVVGLLVDGMLAYLPHTCLYSVEPNYKPKIVDRTP